MIDSYYLFKNIPSIDLHEMNRYEAVMKVEYFIKENKCKNVHLISIIHGKGSGILKKYIHEYLKNSKEIKAYKINIYNDGETIVEI